MFRPVLVTAPTERVVTVVDAAKHCRADDVTEDSGLIAALALAAEQHLDGWSGILGRCLVSQDWRIALCDWPDCRAIRLPFPDVSTVAVKYRDGSDVEQTVSASLYERLEDNRGSFIHLKDGFAFPSVYDDRGDAVTITFTAGYGAAADVPQPIKTAIFMLTAHWYNQREAVSSGPATSVPMAVDALITPYRRMRL